jgi:CubicO group peptidase (beta-lactamase class C family)
MKKYIALLILIVVILIMSFTYIGRYIFWNFADVGDYKKFPSITIHHWGGPFYFRHSHVPYAWELPAKFAGDEEGRDLDAFLANHQTLAFIVIRNDTLLTEKYFDGFSRESVIPVFSVAKSVVSALVGIALEEGLLGSVDDPITRYVGGLTEKGFDEITLEHLLNMRSGIIYSESYFNPFSEMAKFYYGRHLDRYVLKSRIREAPDLHYDYISVNTQLLAMALENQAGIPLPQYLEEKIWKKIGMEYDASWSIDSKKHQRVKSFCCLNARPLDLAKFARLYLNEGNWEGDQIISREWVRRSISIDNDSRDSRGYPYHYHWRVLEDGSFFAKGILGQYIYIDPSRNLIMMRLGKKEADVDWIDFFRELVGRTILISDQH